MKRYFPHPIYALAGLLLLAAMAVLWVAPAIAGQGSGLTYEQAVALTESGDTNQQMNGVDALVLGGDKRAGDALMKLFKDPQTDGVLKISVAYSLGVLGVKSSQDVLISALEQDFAERTGIWSGIIPALGELRSEAAVPVLLKALNKRDDHWLGREMAATALGRIGSPKAVPDLMTAAMLVDTRESAVGALTVIGDSRAVSVFLNVLQDGEEEDIVKLAISGLRKLGDAAVPDMIRQFERYNREYPETRKRIRLCRLLGESYNKQARAALKQVAGDNRDGWVRKCARQQLLIKK